MDLKILPKKQRELWVRLAGIEQIRKFYLAGGTAVALHLKHRESIDYDFFSYDTDPDDALINGLSSESKLTIDSRSSGTLLGQIEGVKISFFRYKYPLLEDPEVFQGIQVLKLEDLVAMKIIAIAQRGTKKDFIDLHAILLSGWNLEAIFSEVDRKFTATEYNKMHLLKSLTYFEDAEEDPMPKMLIECNWAKVKSDLTRIVRNFLKRE